MQRLDLLALHSGRRAHLARCVAPTAFVDAPLSACAFAAAVETRRVTSRSSLAIVRLLACLSIVGLLGAPSSAQQTQSVESQRLDVALASLKPQRAGIVDAFVVVAALDGDAVFGREAREAGRVLARRFDASGHTIVLATDEGTSKADAPMSPQGLTLALTRVAELMDRKEDVLVLYSTSHGEPDAGLVYKDQQGGVSLIEPAKLARILRSLGIKNRLIILQACFAGQFVPALRDANTIVVTAAAADRSSFGCSAGNDWTYFGDALINHAFRQPLPLDAQLRRAATLIGAAEARDDLIPSNPQVSAGSNTVLWLSKLDEREPKSASDPVGQTVLGLGK